MISKNNWEITILFDILSGDFMSYVDQFGDFMSGDFMSGDFSTGYRNNNLVGTKHEKAFQKLKDSIQLLKFKTSYDFLIIEG